MNVYDSDSEETILEETDDEIEESNEIVKKEPNYLLITIKDFLYERQEPKDGRLDGTLYLLKGQRTIPKGVKVHKSIYPTWMRIERHRGRKNKIFYKTFINKDEEGEIQLLNKRNKQEIHFFTKPLGAIHICSRIFSANPNEWFTFIIEGECIANYVIQIDSRMNNQFDRIIKESGIQNRVQNILRHFEYIDFEHHQYYNYIIEDTSMC